MLLFPITAITLVGCLIASHLAKQQRSALTLGLSIWAVEIVLISLPIFQYGVDYSRSADLFAAGCLLATTIAYLFVRRPQRTPPATYTHRRRELGIVKVLAILGVVGCLLLLIDAAAKGTPLSASDLLSNLAYVRSEVFQANTDVFAGPLALAGQMLAPCSVLVLIAAAQLGHSARGRRARLLALGVVSFALNVIVSLFVYGGRIQVFQVLLLVLVSFYLGGQRLKVRPRTIALAVGLVVTIWFFSVTWFQAREGGVNNAEEILEDIQRARLHPLIESPARGNEALGSALINLGYFSSPLPTLSFYSQQPSLPGPFWGQYSFPFPSAVAGALRGEPSDWQARRRELFAPLDAAGYYPNVWATWLRDLLVDFGSVGAVTFCGLFGMFMAAARNRYELTGALHYHYLETISCFVFAFGAFTNILWTSTIAFAFLAAVGAMYAARVTFGERVSLPERVGGGEPGAQSARSLVPGD